MIRYMDPGFYMYLATLRSQRELADQEFRKRRDKAIAKQAVNEQGVGE